MCAAGDRLHQAPAAELFGLRQQDNAWRLKDVPIFSAKATLVPHMSGSALNVEVTLDTAKSEGTAFSVLLVSDGAKGNDEGCVGNTAVSVDWGAGTLKVLGCNEDLPVLDIAESFLSSAVGYSSTTCFVGSAALQLQLAAHNLQVHQLGHIDASAYTFDLADAVSSVGGRAQLAAGEPVHLQVFLDHSALEVRASAPDTNAWQLLFDCDNLAVYTLLNARATSSQHSGTSGTHALEPERNTSTCRGCQTPF